MASFTEDDIVASGRFAEANNTIRLLKKMTEKAPHLATWLNVNIRDAMNEEFYIPSSLKHASKIVTVEITETLCELISCTPVKEQDTCNPNEVASYYYVGDSGAVDVQCQPSCYHSAAKISYNEDGARATDVPQLNWNNKQNKCRIVNSNITSWLEKPFYRSDTKFEIRVNDMPTGFSRTESSNPYGVGYTYKSNKTYCKYYDRTMDNDGACSMTIFEKTLDAIVGMNLINTIKSSIRMLTNNNVPFPLPDLPPKPKLKNIHTLDGWKNNINKSFVLPELIDTKPRRITKAGRSVGGRNDEGLHEYRARMEMEDENMSNFMRTCLGLDVDTNPDKVFGVDENGEILPPMSKKPKDEEDPSKHWTETMKNILIAVLESFSEAETYAYIGIDILSGMALSKIKSLSVKIVERMTVYLGKGLSKMTGSIGLKVLTSGLKGVTTKIVTTMALRVGAKMAIMLAKIMGAAASVIGWLLVGTMLLDFLFMFWDPYGYNNLFPPEIPNDTMESGELALRQALQAATANYEFENLAAVILSEEELITIQLQGLVDRLIYLDALVINSEGSRIDKGKEFNVSLGSTYDMERAQNEGMAQRVKFSPQQFEKYNDKFMTRVKVNKYLNYISGISILLSGICLVGYLPLLSIIFIVVALIALAFSRLELQTDISINLFDKYENKTPTYGQNGYAFE